MRYYDIKPFVRGSSFFVIVLYTYCNIVLYCILSPTCMYGAVFSFVIIYTASIIANIDITMHVALFIQYNIFGINIGIITCSAVDPIDLKRPIVKCHFASSLSSSTAHRSRQRPRLRSISTARAPERNTESPSYDCDERYRWKLRQKMIFQTASIEQ